MKTQLFRRRRGVWRASILAVLMLVAVACGGSDDSGSDSPDGGESEPTEAQGSETESEPAEVEGESVTLRIAIAFPEKGSTNTEYLADFFIPELEKRVAEETNHELEIVAGFGGTIAAAPEVLGATRDGLADIGLLANPVYPSELYLYQLPYYVPFSTSDPEIMFEALQRTMDANPEVFYDYLEENFNQKLLSFGGYASYDMITTFPFDSLDDLEGHKIGVAGKNSAWVEAAGAVPVSLLLPEAYNGLQTGLYEGIVMLPKGITGFKLQEVAKYHTRVQFGAIWSPLVTINLDTYNSLPDDLRTILEEVALEYQNTMPAVIVANEEQALQEMADAGVVTSALPDDEKQKWAELIGNLPNQAAQEANDMGLPGSKVLRDFIQAQKDLGHTFPVDWEIED